MTTLAALAAAACSPQNDNMQRDAAKGNAIAQDRRPILDPCALAQHPERFDGRRVRLRAIIVQYVDSAYLTAPPCMWRQWGGKVLIAHDRGVDYFLEVGPAVMEARRRSTATRGFAAEAEYEGIIRALRPEVPRNATVPVPGFVIVIEVEKVDHVRLVEIPVVQPPEVPVTQNSALN